MTAFFAGATFAATDFFAGAAFFAGATFAVTAFFAGAAFFVGATFFTAFAVAADLDAVGIIPPRHKAR